MPFGKFFQTPLACIKSVSVLDLGGLSTGCSQFLNKMLCLTIY